LRTENSALIRSPRGAIGRRSASAAVKDDSGLKNADRGGNLGLTGVRIWGISGKLDLDARTFLSVLVIAATLATHNSALAESLDAQTKALGLITNTADRICNIVSTNGDANSVEAKGNVNAQLSGLASKLADIGVSGTGGINNEKYHNVIRQDLSATLKDNAACKLKVFESLLSKLMETGSARPVLVPQQAPTNSRPHTGINCNIQPAHSGDIAKDTNWAEEWGAACLPAAPGIDCNQPPARSNNATQSIIWAEQWGSACL
jgi:hypothetical protein